MRCRCGRRAGRCARACASGWASATSVSGTGVRRRELRVNGRRRVKCVSLVKMEEDVFSMFS
eukprot:2451661-Pleurochrysis_carterae.AAC.1